MLTPKQKLIRFLTPVALPMTKVYWRIFKPETKGVKVIVEKGGKFLMIKNSYGYKTWTFPGGSVDKGEALEDAARRELKEETGIEVAEVKFIEKILSTAEGKKDNIFIFYAEVDSEEFHLDEFEIEDGGWFEPDSLSGISNIAKKIWALFKSRNISQNL